MLRCGGGQTSDAGIINILVNTYERVLIIPKVNPLAKKERVDINDLTENVLFIVEHEGKEIMIPAADDLILDIDDENETILMDLPQGLVNIDEAEEE